MSSKHTVGERFKGSAAPPDYHTNPPEALLVEQQQDAPPGPPEALPFEKPWDRPTLAEYMGLTVSGLDKLIKEGRAPPYFKAGRMLRWRPSVVRAWTLARPRMPESEKAARALKSWGCVLPVHPAADLFPMMSESELRELGEDILGKGLQSPITLWTDGDRRDRNATTYLLDGRNRLDALEAVGVYIVTNGEIDWWEVACDEEVAGTRPSQASRVVYENAVTVRLYRGDGDDPYAHAVSLNLKRRHLETSQRALIAEDLATLKDGQRADEVAGTSIEVAARLLNVGRASVERAKIVREEGDPELVAAVERGEVSVSGAVERIRRGINTGVAMHPYAERGRDLYETPPGAVRALLDVEPLAGPIWECACGPGSIVRTLRAAGHRVIATDIESYGCPDSLGGVDFLAQTVALKGATTIFTNPPFTHADDFVRHALKLVPRVIMLQRLAFLESEGRSDILDGGKLARIYVFRNRLTMHRAGWDGPKIDSGAVAFAWMVWNRDHNGPATVHRISWRAEPATPAEPSAAPGELPDIPDFLRRTAPVEGQP